MGRLLTRHSPLRWGLRKGPERKPRNEETVEERLYFREDETFHQRTDWFLACHGILFGGFIAARDDVWLLAPIGAFGLVAAWGWLAVSFRQVENLIAMREPF